MKNSAKSLSELIEFKRERIQRVQYKKSNIIVLEYWNIGVMETLGN